MMVEKLTRIRVPGRKAGDYGLMDWGEKTHAEMVSMFRHRADHLRDVVAAIDATPDAAFEVDIVSGSAVHAMSGKWSPTMVELNEKGLEAGADALAKMYHGESDEPFHHMAKSAISAYLSALPAPDDGLVERLHYRIENPSAWDTFDQGGSDLIAEAATALQSKDEQIERQERVIVGLNIQLTEQFDLSTKYVAKSQALEQQVQKLTADNERLREAQASKDAEFRDKVALGASPDEILRFRDGYPNPAGGPKVFYRHTVEQARYRYADAILAARSALETQEGGE